MTASIKRHVLAVASLLVLACSGSEARNSGQAQTVTVTVSPTAASVLPDGVLTFAATVSGTSNTAVTWSVAEGTAGGTIDSSGTYTAPSATGSYHVVATSDAVPASNAVATVTVGETAGTLVTVIPEQATVTTNSSIQLAASVKDGRAVTWSIEEGAAGGSISNTGLYTAPATPGTYTVDATPVDAAGSNSPTTLVISSTGSGSASTNSNGKSKITVKPKISVSVSPTAASLSTGSSITLTATVSNTTNKAVTWSVLEGSGAGTVTAAGTYTAPSAAGTYHVAATSVADTTASATSTFTVAAPPPPPPSIAVSVTPASAAVTTGGAISFAATVTNSTNQAVTWSVQEGSAGGTISTTGAYTAPPTPGTYHVLATSVAAPSASSTATVAVSAPPISVAINPTNATLIAGGSLTFAATVSNASNQGVSWSVQEGSAGGTITSAGIYTAPATGGTYHVVATSQVDPTKYAIATVAVTLPPTVTVSVSPASASVDACQIQTFACAVSGSSNTVCTWSVLESGGGSITAAGAYTAPAAGGTYHVVATSQADPAKSQTATVTVTERIVSVTVSPSTVSIAAGGTQQFAATVTTTCGTFTQTATAAANGTVVAN